MQFHIHGDPTMEHQIMNAHIVMQRFGMLKRLVVIQANVQEELFTTVVVEVVKLYHCFCLVQNR